MKAVKYNRTIKWMMATSLASVLAIGCAGASKNQEPAESATPDSANSESRYEVNDKQSSSSATYSTPDGASAQQEEISEDKIEAFANAYRKLASLQEEYNQRAMNVATEQEQRQLQTELNTKGVEVIQNHGFTAQDFEKLSRRMGTDSMFRAQVTRKLENTQNQ